MSASSYVRRCAIGTYSNCIARLHGVSGGFMRYHIRVVLDLAAPVLRYVLHRSRTAFTQIHTGVRSAGSAQVFFFFFFFFCQLYPKTKCKDRKPEKQTKN